MDRRDTDILPGFQLIHANHLEDLRDLVVDWIRSNPLDPLETETILVQSNGISQWLKLALAEQGIAMGLEVTLPARLQWRLYRSMPGGRDLPRVSPFDTDRLVWRVMRLLPVMVETGRYGLLERYLSPPGEQGEDPVQRRYDLALRIADLFDQYQVYRADWLTTWATRAGAAEQENGRPGSTRTGHLQWQRSLWKSLIDDTPETLRGTDRGTIHRRYLEYLDTLDPAAARRVGVQKAGIPRRVVVFGISSLSAQMIEVLHGISRFSQVLFCVHNPCRYHWSDIVSGREHFAGARRRRRSRKPGLPEEPISEESLHLHAHPLLAAWGMQGRDYIGLLDRLEPEDHGAGVSEIFRSPGRDSLLHSLQDDILELRSIRETLDLNPAPDRSGDDSLVFHVAHSALREVEILHDQLLDAFDRDPHLRPRDVIVMVPDVVQYAPLISAVFGRLERRDTRYIPFALSDQGVTDSDPIVRALESILALPHSRLTTSEVVDLLESPALRRRFGISEEERETIVRWIMDTGIRWGIDGAHRAGIGFPAGIENNTWRAGLRRILLGYAVGSRDVWNDIVGLEGISGLEADLAGRLAELLDVLDHYRRRFGEVRTPPDWTDLLRRCLTDLFESEEDSENRTIDGLYQALQDWAEACEEAEFQEELPVTVVKDAWLSRLDEPRLTQRFLGGAVTFATLMPMRAIPFRMVCLLGMNDGDYPRQQATPGFDLMQDRNEYRPGDRSRREDDRYLFLEALLSARRRLYISWVGFSISDNSIRPPSVLVGQLRDHLGACYCAPEDLTTNHPLQPFSPEYYKRGSSLFTYVHEWRVTGGETVASTDGDADTNTRTEAGSGEEASASRVVSEITLHNLYRFLRNPVEIYFREGLGVVFDSMEAEMPRDEPFEPDSLQGWALRDELLRDALAEPDVPVHEHMRRQILAGSLPFPPFADHVARDVLGETVGILRRYREETQLSTGVERYGVSVHVTGSSGLVVLQDEITDILEGPDGTVRRVFCTASRVHDGNRSNRYRWEKLLRWWPHHLAAQDLGRPVLTVLVAPHGTVTFPPIIPEHARALLKSLVDAWERAVAKPFIVTPATGCAWIAAGGREDPDKAEGSARKAFKGNTGRRNENTVDRYLQRAWPEPEELIGSTTFIEQAETLYGPMLEALS